MRRRDFITLLGGATISAVVETDEGILAFEVTGDALKRAAVVPEVQVTTIGVFSARQPKGLVELTRRLTRFLN